MQARLVPPVDSEVLRIKLMNEIEGPLRSMIDQKDEII